jgi:hypothetical protein
LAAIAFFHFLGWGSELKALAASQFLGDFKFLSFLMTR